jgi:ribosomal-protein-serine acetyltransferase
VEERRAWIASLEGGEDDLLGIFEAGDVVGGCGLHRRIGEGGLEIGYWIHAGHTRKGFATEATAQLLALAFADPAIDRVEIHHDRANAPSRGVPAKLGFEHVGDRLDEIESPGEEGVEVVWRITRAAWRAPRSPGSLRLVLAQDPREAVPAFLDRWYGSGPAPAPPDERVPRSLRWFHEAYGTAPWALPLNRLLPAPYDDAGRLVVCEDAGGEHRWGIGDAEAGDPPVAFRTAEGWAAESPSVSVFLLQLLLANASMYGDHVALTEQPAGRALDFLTPLELPRWHWPDGHERWYAGEDAIAFSSGGSTWVSALSELGLLFLTPYAGGWSYYSPRDG